MGMNTHVSSYEHFNPDAVKDWKGNTLIGFFSATHGFNMPHSMLKFILHFGLFKGSDVFVGNTRAGIKLYKLFMPGLSGLAMYFPALMLLLKGYKVRAMYPVDLPSNWISIHPGLRRKVIDSMVEHYSALVGKFAGKVLAGQKVFLKSFILLPLDILVIPVSLGYYLVGRYILAKTFVASYKCNNCGICMKNCPTKSIILSGGRPYWKFSCESCMKCMNNCPERAIETAHSVVFILIFILTTWINPWISEKVSRLVSLAFGESWMAYEILLFVFQWSVWLIVFFAGYKVVHYGMRFPLINRLITFTSLTTWKFWRRYRMPSSAPGKTS
jgi:Pyruvate/2-oxoacid:ferredoxin oxidoreductase delta subunit